MPDHEDTQRGTLESSRRFFSLFTQWVCSLTFKQLAALGKSPFSALHSNYFDEQGSNSSSRMDGQKEAIVVLSSDEELSVDWTDDDDHGDESGRNLSKRSLPNWMRTDGGVHMQPPWRTSGKKPYSNDARRSQVESAPSTSSGAGTRSMNSHATVGNGSSSRAKMDDERFNHGQHPNKRALPASFEPSRTHTKQNNSWENLARNRGYFSNGSADNAYMDSNHSRILPPTFSRGKAGPSADNTSTSDPYQNMGSGEDIMGDERVIFQAALQDLSQPKSELDVPLGVLTVPLLRHQKIALAWMVEKESRTMHCLGGILADDQGLGKTISTIALILKQWPAQMKSKSKNNDIHNAEALTLDDDDDDNKGNKIEETHVGKCKLEEVSINGHKMLVVDVDDEDGDDVDGSATAEVVKEMENVDDDGTATAEAVKKLENVEGSKSNSGSSSSHQTFNRQRPSAGTLIVCPATVLRQWHRELNEKVSWKAKLKVLSYHGGNRIKDPAKLADYDVVLTTYSIVANEVPKQPIVDEEDGEQKNGERYGQSSDFNVSKKRKHPSTKTKGKKGKKLADNSLYSQAGALARVNWFRVVLDEAQTIKNHRTLTARACCGLRAKRRWCLSGTPIQNSVDEMYSYFRFLRHQYYSSYKNFYDYIKNPISRDPNIGYKKLQAVLRTLLLRRTKDTLLDGEPIISLPPKTIAMKTVNFTVEERAFYSQLEAESRSQFKAFAAAGTVNQNYANILLMILRLRQACDHPILVTGFNSNSARRTNLDKAKELPRHLLTELLNHLETASAICLLCSDPAEDAVVTICGHVFCYQCVGDYISGDDTQCPARRCKEQLSEDIFFSKATLKSCLSGDVDGSVSSENVSSNSSSILSNEYSSSKIKAALEILFSNCQLNSQSMEHDELREATTENSMPVQVRTEILEDSSSQGPIKTIIFSQWTRMLDLFEHSLNLYCIQFRRLDGSMSLAARDGAVRDFNTDPEVTVMLMSLKAGNLGLNMVAACHVILLDLWWNPTTEDQAIDRAHRIGQTRPVTVSRITIKDTVEDRILALQEEKRTIVASAFGEEHVAGSKVKLTAEDLRFFLFGSRAF